jgi:hypothetical protein
MMKNMNQSKRASNMVHLSSRKFYAQASGPKRTPFPSDCDQYTTQLAGPACFGGSLIETRRKKPRREPTFAMQNAIPAPETVRVLGYGSPEAMEAASDAHVIWSRATPPMRSVIRALMDDKSQVNLASEMKSDRFKVARMIKTWRKFVIAA